MFDGRGSFCKNNAASPIILDLSLFTRRKLLCEAVWLAGYKTEEWQKEEVSVEELRG